MVRNEPFRHDIKHPYQQVVYKTFHRSKTAFCQLPYNICVDTLENIIYHYSHSQRRAVESTSNPSVMICYDHLLIMPMLWNANANPHKKVHKGPIVNVL